MMRRRFTFGGQASSVKTSNLGPSAPLASGELSPRSPPLETVSELDRVERYRSGSLINDALLRSRLVTKLESAEDFMTAPKNLSEVLRSQKLRYAFRTFLRKRTAAESLLFFEAVELYETMTNPSWRARTGEGIMNKFIRQGAVHEVNVAASLRAALVAMSEAKDWHEHSFDKAKRELFLLMNSNFFEAFCEAYWPGGVLLAKPGDPFSSDRSLEWDDSRLGSGSSRPDGSTATVTSNGHLHDDETVMTLAYLVINPV